MGIKTGCKKAELTRLADSIEAQGVALVADFPAGRLQRLQLTCCCDRCIDPDALAALCRINPAEVTDDLISQCFGGVGAVGTLQDEEARYEARAILTHVLRQLGHATCLKTDDALPYMRVRPYFDADYLVPHLVKTGFIPRLPPEVQTQLRAYLVDVVRYAIATGSRMLDKTLSYLCIFTDAFLDVLEQV